jgi:hypothetical protein
MMNLRMLELRAAHYSKVYPERLASSLMTFCIYCLVIWVALTLVTGSDASDGTSGAHKGSELQKNPIADRQSDDPGAQPMNRESGS